MTFNGKMFGGKHRTRRAAVMADGRVKEHSEGEAELGDMLTEMGFYLVLDRTLKTPKVHIPAAWTNGRYDHDIDLEPDWIVQLGLEMIPGPRILRWVVNYDAWATHNRTLEQMRRDERHDGWYLRAGYHICHVGDNHFANLKSKAALRPKLAAALKSNEPVVNLSR